MDRKKLLVLFGFIFLFSIVTIAYTYTPNGLKTYISFNANGTIDEWYDIQGFPDAQQATWRNPTIYGSPQSKTGKLNNATFFLNEIDGYAYADLNCSTMGFINSSLGNFTLSMTLNISQQLSPTTDCQILMCENNGVRNIIPFYMVNRNDNSGLRIRWNDCTSEGCADSLNISIKYNQWDTFFLVKSGENISLYKNDTYITSKNFSTFTIRYNDKLSINRAGSVGNAGYGCNTTFLDEFRMYNRSLIQSEVTNDYRVVWSIIYSAPEFAYTTINFTDIYNLTNSTINSTIKLYDNTSGEINISLNWFVNNLSVVIINTTIQNNTATLFELGYGNFSRYNDIFYQVIAFNLNDTSLTRTQNSSRVNVLNAVPSFVNLSYPDNGTTVTYLNLTAYNSTDIDGDTIHYGFYLNNSLRCWSTDRNCTNLTYNYNGTYNWTAFASDLVSNTSNATMRWFGISAIPIISSATITPAAPEDAENIVCNYIINDDEQFNCTVKIEWFDTGVLNPHYTASFFVNASDYLVSKATNSTDGNYPANETAVAESIYCRVNATDAFGLNVLQNATAVTISADTVAPPGGGGGGGGGTVTTIITTAEKIDFQLQSDTGSSSYQFYMNAGDKRTRSVIVLNKGDMLKDVKITCESDNAELCSWVTLEKASVDVNTQQNAPVNFDINVPANAVKGDYNLRLKGDYIGTEDYVDVNIIVGSWWGFLLKEIVFKISDDLPVIPLYVWEILAGVLIFGLIIFVALLNLIFREKNALKPFIPYIALFLTILVDLLIIAFI